MPQGRFNEYSPQEQAALARDMLAKAGRPITANNLNAAMLALMRNEELPSNNMDAAIERTMQPRRQPARQPAQQPTAPRDVRMLNQDVDAEAALADGDPNADGNRSMRDVREAGAVPVEPRQEPDLAAEFPGGGGSHSNVGGNTTLMQAIERMLLPLGIAAIAGQSQRMLTGPRGELPAPTAPATQAATPPAQVGSARQGQAELPRPDADLHRRMIDRNMQRSERNAARTHDERAAGNNNKERRERIERVPAGTIRLPFSRGNRRDTMRDEQ